MLLIGGDPTSGDTGERRRRWQGLLLLPTREKGEFYRVGMFSCKTEYGTTPNKKASPEDN